MAKDAKELITQAKQKLNEADENASKEWEAKLKKEEDEKGAEDKEAVKESDEAVTEETVTEEDDKEDEKDVKKESKVDLEVDTHDDSDTGGVKKEDEDEKKDEDDEDLKDSYRPEEQPATQSWPTDPWKQLSVKEDIDAMFDGVDGLSEDFKTKVETIYEAALKSKLEEALKELQEHAEKLVEERVAKIEEQTVNQANEFVGYVVEEWLLENQLQVENGIRVELAEGLLGDLQKLMETYHVTLPAEKIDLLDEKTKEADSLKGEVSKLTEKVIELDKTIFNLQKGEVIATLSEGLAATEVEKLKSLVKDIEVADLASFKEKAGIIKESFFKGSTKVKPNTTEKEVIVEDVDPAVARYMQSLNKSKQTD